MCGIAGLMHKKGGNFANIGAEMTGMLQSLKHRGPDSTGFAMYKDGGNKTVMRVKVAEHEDAKKIFEVNDKVKHRLTEIDNRLNELGVKVLNKEKPTEFACRIEIDYEGDVKKLVDYIEDIDGVEILSFGKSLELIKDLGDATVVSNQYNLAEFSGSHAIGHTRMATESDIDIRSAHPYWAYPFRDVSVVHNGQLTNYWTRRRSMERKGHRFASNCDSELIAVYIAEKMDEGVDLETAMIESIDYLDGVFTYLVATKDALGMAKDVMAAKPMVLYEGKDMIAMASEEVAIRQLFNHQIETYDPYEGEVKVWRQ